MKNFSEATATRVQLKIALDLRPIGNPCVRVSLGENVLLDGIISTPLHLEHSHDLLKPLRFTLELSNKEYSQEHETAVVVEQFSVDNVSLVPEMTHHFHYNNDHRQTSPTNYIGFNGTWQLNTVDCFYKWWHQQSGQGWIFDPTA